MTTKYKPFKIMGPGFLIKEEMKANNRNQKELAEILGYSEKHVSNLIQNRVPITLETAVKLSKAFGSSPKFWMNLDMNYRLKQVKDIEFNEEEERAHCYNKIPVRIMRKYGWLNESDGKLVENIKHFFHVDTLDFDELQNKARAYWRKSEVHKNFNEFFAFIWLQQAKNIVSNVTIADYSKEKLLVLVEDIPEISAGDKSLEVFVNRLKECGVHFICLQHLDKTYLDGAAFYHGNIPVIVYTARYDRLDNFWFTVIHEIAHVLLHLQENSIPMIDDMRNIDDSNKFENEANMYSSQILKNSEILKYFDDLESEVSISDAIDCAKRINISPAIVVGCWQYHKRIKYSQMRELLTPVKECLLSL